jgi:hypothetical protein
MFISLLNGQTRMKEHTAFNPTLDKLGFSFGIHADGVSGIFNIDHQTWPTSHTHNGRTHVFDETSPVRLTALKIGNEPISVVQAVPLESDIEPWKAKWLIGKEWQEDEKPLEKGKGKGKEKELVDQPQVASTSTSAPDRDVDTAQMGKRGSTEESDQTPDKRQKIGENTISGPFPPQRDSNPAPSHMVMARDSQAGSHSSNTRLAAPLPGSNVWHVWVTLTDGEPLFLLSRQRLN